MKRKYVTLFVLLTFVLMSSGCLFRGMVSGGHEHPVPAPEVVKQGPPPWAPAHGHRAKHVYRYYPSSQIYFDTGKGLYFFLKNRAWTMSASLPGGIRLSVNDFVTIEMDHDRPYTYHADVQKKYPPGHLKKKDKDKKKKKDKHRDQNRDRN